MIKFIGISAVLVLSLTHCSRGNEEDRGQSGEELTADAESYSSEAAPVLSSAEVVNELASSRFRNLLLNRIITANTLELTPEAIVCPEARRDLDVINATGHNLEVRLKGDFGPCVFPKIKASTPKAGTGELVGMNLYVDLKYGATCPNKDFSNLNGTAATERAATGASETKCELQNLETAGARSLAQTRSVFLWKNLPNFPADTTVGSVLTDVYSAAGGDYCLDTLKNQQIHEFGDCTRVIREEGNRLKAGRNGAFEVLDFQVIYKIKGSNLAASSASLHFSRGKLEITINNWSGTVDFFPSGRGGHYRFVAGAEVIERDFGSH